MRILRNRGSAGSDPLGAVAPVAGDGAARQPAAEPAAPAGPSRGRSREAADALEPATSLSRAARCGVCPARSTRPMLRLPADVFQAIHDTVGTTPPETGGMLGGDRAQGTATRFVLDATGRRTSVSYSPDHGRLNQLLADWNDDGTRLIGFCHSHPRGATAPSGGDREYAGRILRAIPSLERLFVPIVMSAGDGGPFEIRAWAAVRDGDSAAMIPADLQVIPAVGGSDALARLPADFPLRATAAPPEALVPAIRDLYARANGRPWLGDAESLVRVEGAYDIPRLAASRLILAGLGGARSLAVDLARAGIREFVLIDPDVVSMTNLATQFALRREIGRPKVDCARDDILAAAPDAEILVLQARIEDIDDATLESAARAPWRRAVVYAAGKGQRGLRLAPLAPEVTLLCGLSDSFAAQAHVNQLALAHGLPSLCAQMYQDGRAGEITFTYPGVTVACHRCMLQRRYEAYEAGYRNTVTSAGAPIFATQRVNALTGFIALALLHHGTAHPRWGGLLERITPRTLVQIRMDPDVAAELGLGVFDRVLANADQDRLVFDEAVWLPQSAVPDCPDCHGRGPRQGVETSANERGAEVPAIAGGAS